MGEMLKNYRVGVLVAAEMKERFLFGCRPGDVSYLHAFVIFAQQQLQKAIAVFSPTERAEHADVTDLTAITFFVENGSCCNSTMTLVYPSALAKISRLFSWCSFPVPLFLFSLCFSSSFLAG